MEAIDKTGALDIDALPAAEWHIDGDGLLTIAPPAGCDRAVLAAVGGYDESTGSRAPWRSRTGDVKGVLARPGVAVVGDATQLFGGLKNLERADVSELDVSGVDDMASMFKGCSSLLSLDLRGWDVSKVDFMDEMFYGCSSLESLDLSGWDVSRVEEMDDMFYGCGDVELALDGCGEESAGRLRALLDDSLPEAEWGIDGDGLLVIAPPAGRGRAVLAAIDINVWGAGSAAPWRSRADEVRGVLVGPGVIAAGNAAGLFAGLKNLERADVSELDVWGVECMRRMFEGCSSLKSLDLRGWDVSKVWDMRSMFEGCSSLLSLDLRGWDVLKVDWMDGMFEGCSSFLSLDLSSWDVSGVEDMSRMFRGCSSLRSLDLSGWDVSEVDTGAMFDGCESLDEVRWG